MGEPGVRAKVFRSLAREHTPRVFFDVRLLRCNANMRRTTLIRPARAGLSSGTGTIRTHLFGRRALSGAFRLRGWMGGR